MAIGIWVKYSNNEGEDYSPLSGEKSFKQDLLPIITSTKEWTWIKNLPSGIVINLENIMEVISELESLRINVMSNVELPQPTISFYAKRLKMTINILQKIRRENNFEEAYLG